MPTLFSNENIVFPADSNVLVAREFTHNGVTIPASINPRTGLAFNIDNTGATDVTEQLQEFLDTRQFVGSNAICYLPNGTYLVSSTLRFAGYLLIGGVAKIDVTVTQGSTTITATTNTLDTVTVGQTVVGTGIPPSTTVVSVNAAANSIVISNPAWCSWSEGTRQKRHTLQGQDVEGTRIKLTDNNALYQNPAASASVINTGSLPAQRFSQNVRNLTIDVGTDNPGAVGLRYTAHNQGSARELIIISSDPGKVGHAGIDIGASGEPGPCLLKNIQIIGFSMGILSNHATASVTIENLELEGQLQYGIYQGDNYAQTLSCRKIISKNSVPVYYDLIGNDTIGAPSFIDCTFTNNGTPTAATAIVCDRSAIFLRNIVCSDYAKTFTNAFDSAEAIGNVSEYSTYNGASLGYTSSYKCNHGTVKSLELPIKETPVIPLEQDFTKWARVTTTAQFQAACDTPGITTIYIPQSANNYSWTGDIYLRGDVRRVIGCEAAISGSARLFVDEGTHDTVIIERLKNLPTIINISSRAVVISACYTLLGGSGATVPNFSNVGNDYGINKIGTGDLFIEDMCLDTITAYGINIWCRQFNPENPQTLGKVIIYNCKFWCLGVKTEKESTQFFLRENSQAEIWGMIYATSDVTSGKIKPIIDSWDSEYNIVCYSPVLSNSPFLMVALERNNGVSKPLPRPSDSTGSFSYNLTTSVRYRSNRIKTKNIAPALVNCEIENCSFKVGDGNNAWNEYLTPVFNSTKQNAIALHLAEFRDSKIQYNKINGQVATWNSKGRNNKIQYNTFDFEKVNSTGICIGLHDSGLTVNNNSFINYGTAIINRDNPYPGAHVSLTNNPAPLIHNNIFINGTNNVVSFFGDTFTSFPFRFYNNTIIIRDNTKPALLFGVSFNQSSAISFVTSGLNIYSDFRNNLFDCVTATGSSGIPSGGSSTKSNNGFNNVTSVGTNPLTFTPNFQGSRGISLWEYKLLANSSFRNTGIAITGITPASDVSVGSLQYGAEWNLETPGNTSKKINILPADENYSSGSSTGGWGSFGLTGI